MVTARSCTCVAKALGKCKHVAGVVYYINNHSTESKTSRLQSWGKPNVTTAAAKAKYSEYTTIASLWPEKSMPVEEQAPTTLAETMIFADTFYGNKHTQHGVRTEPKARDEYCKIYCKKVECCGLICHVNNPWLCGSPDGIVLDCNNKPERILEIKCPSTVFKTGIKNPNGTLNVKYLQIENGT
ncbi:hypothetical protein B566_EDAN016686, partial [Ephemera danica]